MRIRLDDERRQDLREDLQRLFSEELDRDLSDFQAERLVDFFVRSLGPPVYNQAVQDARKFMLERLDDLEGEIWEPEPSREDD
jgi:uncharacterized protein (DUF2164 family)